MAPDWVEGDLPFFKIEIKNGRDTLRISAACCVVSIWDTGTSVTASPRPIG